MFCNKFYFAVDRRFPVDKIPKRSDVGVIVVYDYGGVEVVRRCRRTELDEFVDVDALMFMVSRKLNNNLAIASKYRSAIKFGELAFFGVEQVTGAVVNIIGFIRLPFTSNVDRVIIGSVVYNEAISRDATHSERLERLAWTQGLDKAVRARLAELGIDDADKRIDIRG